MMKKILIGTAAVMSVAGATLATSTVADAAPYGGYHGGYGYRGGGGGVALGAGILGLAVGASLASPYYGYAPGYYAPGYYAPGYYAPGYYGYYGGYRGYYGRGYYGHGGWHR